MTLLNALETDKHDFESAKTLLTEALASSETRIFSLIRSLTELSLSYTDDPYEYIAKVKNIQEAIKKLKVNIDHFLQFFVWHGLNDSFNPLTPKPDLGSGSPIPEGVPRCVFERQYFFFKKSPSRYYS